jgi:hypothetical protein
VSTATPTPSLSSTPSAGPTNPSSGPWSESLTWTGAKKGRLSQAYGTCHLYPGSPTDVIDLHNADHSIALGIPRDAPGVVPVQDLPAGGGGLSIHFSGAYGSGLYIATKGSATYGQDGDMGSVDAWLAPEVGITPSPTTVHLVGAWRCV